MHSRHRLRAAALGAAALFSLLIALQALWIPAKAALAQALIARSWQIAQAGDRLPPWPWADTHTVARLAIPALDRELFVLAGNSGRNLAFGPALDSASSAGDWIIHGHRDTHFASLDNLRAGDRLQIERPGSATRDYQVVRSEVVDSRRVELVVDPGQDRLSLVTCYPLHSLRPGGPLRYVVTALPVTGPVLRTHPRASG
jgi:sortase A